MTDLIRVSDIRMGCDEGASNCIQKDIARKKIAIIPLEQIVKGLKINPDFDRCHRCGEKLDDIYNSALFDLVKAIKKYKGG